MSNRPDRLAAFVSRLPKDYRPSGAAVGAAQDAYAFLRAARPLNVANQAVRAKQMMISGMARAIGDLTSDITGGVGGAVDVGKSISDGNVSGAIAGGIKVAGAIAQTVKDANGSSSSSDSVGSGMTNTQQIQKGPPYKVYDQTWDGQRATIKNLKASADGKKTAADIQKMATTLLRQIDEYKNHSRAGQPWTAYYSLNGGAWVPIPGKWAADGVHFIPNTPLPAGAHLLVTPTGLPPTVDTKTAVFRIQKTTSGGTVAAPQSTSSPLPIAAVALGGALLAAKMFVGG